MRGRTVALVGLAMATVVTGHLATSASRRSPARASVAPDDRPNIVLVLMDDFSLELLATMSQARRMQAEGATYRNAHVVDSLVLPLARGHLHWSSAAPDARPDEHAPRLGRPDRRLRRIRAPRQRREGLQRGPAAQRLHDGIHRQVHERLRHVHRRPGPARGTGQDSRVGRARGGSRWRLPGMGLLEHLRRRAGDHAASPHAHAGADRTGRRARPRLCHQRHGRPGRGLPAGAGASRPSPSSSRSRPTVRTPR